ncbi:hypothetical protein [Natronococcus roseus]|uniref:hypothetical protein n=1 Tax=Natronococcus roseus TaxID=1052014 RepID=UPI00374DA3EC
MGTQLTEADVGKPVETADGERVGVVASLEGATAEIDYDSDALESLRGALGQNVDTDAETVSFGEDDVGGVTDETVRLERAGDDRGPDPHTEDETVAGRDDKHTEDAEGRSAGADESGRSGEALEPETEEMDEAGDERHPDTEEAPPEGDRTVTRDRGKDEDR